MRDTAGYCTVFLTLQIFLCVFYSISLISSQQFIKGGQKMRCILHFFFILKEPIVHQRWAKTRLCKEKKQHLAFSLVERYQPKAQRDLTTESVFLTTRPYNACAQLGQDCADVQAALGLSYYACQFVGISISNSNKHLLKTKCSMKLL